MKNFFHFSLYTFNISRELFSLFRQLKSIFAFFFSFLCSFYFFFWCWFNGNAVPDFSALMVNRIKNWKVYKVSELKWSEWKDAYCHLFYSFFFDVMWCAAGLYVFWLAYGIMFWMKFNIFVSATVVYQLNRPDISEKVSEI